MKRMKVIHVLNTSKYSGAENVAITLINNIKNNFDCVYVSPQGAIEEKLIENNIYYYPIKGDTLNVKELKQMIKNLKPDIIHAHDFTASILSTFVCKNIPVISHLHHNPPWIKKFCFKSISYYLSSFKYRKILAVSKSVMDEYIFGQKLLHKSMIIGNPIDLCNILKLSTKYDNKQDYDVIFLGRLAEEKNPHLFIEIVSEIAKLKPNLKVAIVGDGELREEIKQLIISKNISNNIDMLGFVNNPYPILKKSKILCIPSKWEGFGLVSVEALCLGKPVVASSVGGLVNIVDNKCGKLCNEKEDFIKEINKLLSDSNYYNSKKEAALESAKKFDNMIQYKNNIMKIYQNK